MNIDPELAAALPNLPNLHIDDLARARGVMHGLSASAPATPTDGVVIHDRHAPGSDGRPDVPVRVYTPDAVTGPRPALLLLHGGGFVMGDVEAEHAIAVHLCREVGLVAISVDYRLAPEHPFPAALEDCDTALAWTSTAAAELGVDPDRIGLYGMSAGGGLAAGLTMLARDRGGPRVCFQVLDAPELDDRLDTASMLAFVDTPLWSRPDAVLSWQHYLIGTNGQVPVYAAPARATELAGLPPAYLVAYENDPLRDEGLGYASRLLQAGVSVELHLYPGTFHRSMIIGSAAVSRRQVAELTAALQRGLALR